MRPDESDEDGEEKGRWIPRMHSMPRWCLSREGDVCLGVSALWVCPGHVYPRGGVYTPLDQEADTPRQTPPSHCMLGHTPCPLHVGIHTPLPIVCWDTHPLWTEWHTGVKTLPFPKLCLQTVTRGLLRRCIKIIRDGSYRHFETCMSLKHMHMMCVFYCIFTPKPPYSIVIGKLWLAIWDTSFWTFLGQIWTQRTLRHILGPTLVTFGNMSLFRWFKFTLKPPYSIAIGKLWLAIWDTSFWTFLVKFGHKEPWVSSEICHFLVIPVPFEYFSENDEGENQKIKVFSLPPLSV